MRECPSEANLDFLLSDRCTELDRRVLENHIETCSMCQTKLAGRSSDDGWQRLLPDDNHWSADGPPLGACLSSTATVAVEGQDSGERPPGAPTIAGYTVQEEIGRGGMGVVYRARHLGLNRVVALKVLAQPPDDSPERWLRFRNEALAVARLQHANIVQVFDSGEENGVPFVAQELADSGSLDQRIDGTPWSVSDAVELVRQLAGAVQHAHSQGVLHRDIKPSNILYAGDVFKLADFGLAKLLDCESNLTQTRDVIGTPTYMAPEQTTAEQAVIGPGTDVFALGVLLYELLTGRPPFQADTAVESLKLIQDHEPVSPRRLQPGIPSDVETICLKCLEKNPRHRYHSAAALAHDLECWLHDRPVLARPVSRPGRILRWSRRNPAAAAVLVLAFAWLVTATVLWRRSEQFRHEAETAADRERAAKLAERAAAERQRLALHDLEQRSYPDRIRRAHREWLANDVTGMHRTLAACPDWLRHWEWHYLNHLPQPPTRSWQAHASRIRCAAVSPDSRWLATGADDTLVKIHRVSSGEHVTTLRRHSGYVTDVGFSPDGRLLASSGRDGRLILWRTSDWQRHKTMRRGGPVIQGINFSDNGRLASVGQDSKVRIHDAATGEELFSRDVPRPPDTVALSPDGRRLIVGFIGRSALWVNVATGESRDLDTSTVVCAVWSESDRWFAAGGKGQVWLFDAFTTELLHRIDLESENVIDLGHAHGRLAVASRHRSIGVFQTPEARRLVTIRGHNSPIGAAEFIADGRTVVSGDDDGVVNTWSTGGRSEFTEWSGHSEVVQAIAPSPDGELVASASRDGTVMIRRTSNGALVHTLPAHVGGAYCVAFSPNGHRLASGGADQCVRVWDVRSGEPLRCMRGHQDEVWSVTFDGRGMRIASGSRDATVRLWHAETGSLHHVLVEPPSVNTIHGVLFSANDKSVIAATGATLRTWDTESGRLTSSAVAYAPVIRDMVPVSGDELLTVTSDGSVGLRRRADGAVLGSLRASTRVLSIAATADGHRAVTTHTDATLRIWDLDERVELLSLRAPCKLASVVFGPDDRRLYAGAFDGSVLIWDIHAEVVPHTSSRH